METKKKQSKAPEHIGLVRNDSWLEPFEAAIRGRHDHAVWKINQLTKNGKKTLSDFASGHLYFGLHKLAKGWVFREWAPNATDIYLIGDFNNWQENEKYRCKRIEGTGNWELKLSEKALKHGQLYKMKVKWNGGEGERIPAWCRRVVQDDNTKIFSAQVWNPEKKYEFKKKNFKPKKNPLLIYECHVGMGQDAEKVGTYTEFKDNVLPRVIKDGYNCINGNIAILRLQVSIQRLHYVAFCRITVAKHHESVRFMCSHLLIVFGNDDVTACRKQRNNYFLYSEMRIRRIVVYEVEVAVFNVHAEVILTKVITLGNTYSV